MVSRVTRLEQEQINNLGIGPIFQLKECDQLCKAIFQQADKDLSGYLENDEIAEAIQKIANIFDGDTLNKKEMNEILQIVDVDGDGQISFVELKIFFSFLFKLYAIEVEYEKNQQKKTKKSNYQKCKEAATKYANKFSESEVGKVCIEISKSLFINAVSDIIKSGC